MLALMQRILAATLRFFIAVCPPLLVSATALHVARHALPLAGLAGLMFDIAVLIDVALLSVALWGTVLGRLPGRRRKAGRAAGRRALAISH